MSKVIDSSLNLHSGTAYINNIAHLLGRIGIKEMKLVQTKNRLQTFAKLHTHTHTYVGCYIAIH